MKVGILGLAGAGKDTFANMLLEHLPDFKIDRYARPLKELTCRIFGLTMEEVEDRVLKEQVQRVQQDTMIEEVLYTLTKVLRFTPEQLEQASELYFEHLGHYTELSPRKFQQIFGTDVVRAVQEDAWVQRLQKVPKNLIVPDVRFENELCDVNFLIAGVTPEQRPEHISEHYAWNLVYGKQYVPPAFIFIDNDPDYTTLEHLADMAKCRARRIPQQL
ncbi:putative dNMP kinase [Vibrio phage vB_VhaP_VH-5]|uniref:Putative dNMP kinase n=1 Tax=Vibrio phage vB_VhaP_VH-5 TaxID=2660694 RepID=A0A5Q2W6E1_9CAUD|nr:putative dNMP kinase [Vibrio phage vB_VhaP_VH-5]